MSDETQSRTMDCPDCGGTVSKRAASCPHCGAPIAADEANVPTSSDAASTNNSDDQTAVGPVLQPEAKPDLTAAVDQTKVKGEKAELSNESSFISPNATSQQDTTLTKRSLASRLLALWTRYDLPLKMRNRAFSQKQLIEGERILRVGRFHPIHWRLRWMVHIATIMIVFLVGFWVLYEANYFLYFLRMLATEPGADNYFLRSLPHLLFVGVGLGAIMLSILLSLLNRCYYYNRVYKTEFVLTNKRLITKRGFLRTVVREIQLQKVESVDYGQIIFERWLGIGRLTVRGTGGGKVGKFTFLRDALEFRKRILTQIDKVSG